MSENELDSYRFLSGEDSTDEMLEAIISEARDAAIKKAEDAQKRFEADYGRQYARALQIWGSRIDSMCNGNY